MMSSVTDDNYSVEVLQCMYDDTQKNPDLAGYLVFIGEVSVSRCQVQSGT